MVREGHVRLEHVVKTGFELTRDLALGDYYARKDEGGVAHLIRFGDAPNKTRCAVYVRLVYHEDNSVMTYATCLWCVGKVS